MAEEVEVNAGLRIDCENRGSLVPNHHCKGACDEHRDDVEELVRLFSRGLLALVHEDEVTCRQEQGDGADRVREVRNSSDAAQEDSRKEAAECKRSDNEVHDSFLSLCRRKRIVRFHTDRAESSLLKEKVNERAECTENTEHEEGEVVTRNLSERTCDDRRHSTDVRKHVGDCERTVTSLIALCVELTHQGVERASADHCVDVTERVLHDNTRHAETRNRKQEVQERSGKVNKAICFSVTEDAVRHVGTDDTEDRTECRVQGDHLRRLNLGEAEAFRCRCVEIVDENRAHAVAGKRGHEELKADDSDTERMADEATLILKFLELSLLLLSLCIQFCVYSCFHKILLSELKP